MNSPIRAPYKRLPITPKVSPLSFNPSGGINEILKLISELNAIKSSLLTEHKTIQDKALLLDQKMQEMEDTLTEIKLLAQGEAGESINEQDVIEELWSRLPTPENGKDADEEAIIQGILNRLPAIIDRKGLVKEVLKQIPPPQKLVKGIHYDDGKPGENADPETVIEELFKSLNDPQGKKFNIKHIDGLDAAMRTINSQMGKKFLHGGGDTLKAGTGYTLQRNSDGTTTLVIAGASGTAVYGETPSGSGTAFTLAHTPTAGSLRLYRGGARLKLTDDYTLSAASITLVFTLQAGEILIADYSY